MSSPPEDPREGAPDGPPAGPPDGAHPGGRLHPAAIAVWASQQAIGVVLIVLFGGGPSGFGLPIAVGALVLAVGGAAVRWSRFRWAVRDGALVVEQGLLRRSRRVIPVDRVQSVDLIRPLRHRLLGVVQVRVEAIGGGDSEGQLEALDRAAAFGLQHALLGTRADRGTEAEGGGDADGDGQPGPTSGPPPGGQPHGPVRRLGRVGGRDLVLAGLTGGRVGVVALALGGLQQVVGDRFGEAAALLPDRVTLATGVLLAALAAVVVFGLSVAATVVAFWDFTVQRDDRELRISRGLLEQRLETIPLARIQSLRIEQNLLRRPLGLASVTADLAGRAGGADAGTGLLLPIGPVAQARALVADLLGDDAPVVAALEPPPARSRRRYVGRGLALGGALAVAGLALVVGLGTPAWTPVPLGLLGAAVGVPAGVAWWSALGSATVDGVLVARTGLIVRRRVHVPVARVQRMSARATPLQRRLGLADVQIGIARSGGWRGPEMPELDADRALALLAATVRAAAIPSRPGGSSPGLGDPRPLPHPHPHPHPRIDS